MFKSKLNKVTMQNSDTIEAYRADCGPGCAWQCNSPCNGMTVNSSTYASGYTSVYYSFNV